MARKALEAVFGALGSGLVGYGRDEKRRFDETQTEMDREERRKRQELTDSLTAAEMMESGRWGSEAQLRERQGGAARTVLSAALGAVPSAAGRTNAVLPTDMATASGTLSRGQNAPKVSVGGQDLRMLQTAEDERRLAQAQSGMDRSARRMEGREDAAFESGLRTKEQAAAEAGRRTTTETRLRATGLTPNDRAYAATLQYARTPIQDFMGDERLPTEEEVRAFAEQAKKAEAVVYSSTAPAAGGTGVGGATEVLKRKPGETIAQYLARTGSP